MYLSVFVLHAVTFWVVGFVLAVLLVAIIVARVLRASRMVPEEEEVLPAEPQNALALVRADDFGQQFFDARRDQLQHRLAVLVRQLEVEIDANPDAKTATTK